MSNSEYSNETESSIGQGKGGVRDDQRELAEKYAILGGVDLSAEITNVMRSMMPSIEKETLKKVQAILETKERLKEEELQELQNRKMFLKTSPPQFHGDMDPIVVSDWIMEMENAFDLCMCSDDRKVLYASFMLRGSALYRWNMIKESRGKETLLSMSWDQFKELVCENYILESQKRRLQEEFDSVYQLAADSVQDYTVKFNKNVRFGKINAATENMTIESFIKGLHEDICGRVDSANLKTFEEVVQQAEVAEKAIEDEKELRKFGP